jgi:periplasmic protein TonB
MFEQSVLPSVHTKRPVAFVAVTAAELLLIAAAVIIPLFLIPPLMPAKLSIPLRFIRAVTLVKADLPKSTTPVLTTRRAFTPPSKFYAPHRVPIHVAPVPDIGSIDTPDVSLAAAVSGAETGVPEALGGTGIPILAPPHQPTPKPKAPAPVRVSQGVQEAKLINRVVPVYPRLAIETRQVGRVHLVATIGKDGRVRQIQVIGGPAFLVAAAVEAVKQWAYRPTLLNGQPVEVIAPIEINFILNQ